MTDEIMLSHFREITGMALLSCKCCGKYPVPIRRFAGGIRTRCVEKRMKGGKGIYKGMPVPKTCDKQQAVNRIANPTNNKHYPEIRAAVSDDHKIILLEARDKDLLVSTGIVPKRLRGMLSKAPQRKSMAQRLEELRERKAESVAPSLPPVTAPPDPVAPAAADAELPSLRELNEDLSVFLAQLKSRLDN